MNKIKKDILKLIEEKEYEIKEQQIKLELANKEIEKIVLELKELKNSINESVKDNMDIQIEEKKDIEEISYGKNLIKEGNISIEMVEVNESNEISNAINRIMDEVESYNSNKKIEVINEINNEEALEDYKNEEENKLTIIEELKLSFIENKNCKSIEILSEILNNKDYLEYDFKDDEKLILLYLAYFYNRLEELLSKNKELDKYYKIQSDELNILSMLIRENEYPLYNQVDEIVIVKINENKNLFRNLETMIRLKIIDKIKSISIKSFNGVYSVKDLKCGEENISSKAWVKEKNTEQWRLVEGLYSANTERLYMLDSAICVLNLNILELTEEEKNHSYKVKPIIKSVQDKSLETLEKSEIEDNDDKIEDEDIKEDNKGIWTGFKKKFKLKFNK